MSYSSEDSTSPTSGAENNGRKLKGVRQRKWGKWVSEIRVPGTQDRLWLGSFSTAEAAAVARDVAYYCLRKPSTLEGLNFPMVLPSSVYHQAAAEMSPRSIQKAASDAGMAVDAQLINSNSNNTRNVRPDANESRGMQNGVCWEDAGESSAATGGEAALSISIEDYL